MGCAVSLRKSAGGHDGDDLLVSLCRERKRLMKSAVERRYAFAGAHSKYNQSLYAVALALRLFIARHSASPSSSFLITFPAPSPTPTIDLHHTQSKSVAVEEADDGDDNDDSNTVVCKHFYDDGVVVDPAPPAMTSPNPQDPNDVGGWDFFNPFDNLLDSGKGTGGYEDSRKKLKAEDGGGDVKTTMVDAKVSHEVIDDHDGRELLEALKDVEDHFIKAYGCGAEFSKMLELTNMGPLDHLDLKESSEKFIPTITWHKSTITRSPSCRSLLSSSSRSSSTWTGINSNSDLFDETGGMESGSHLSTLGRLYAWEKKLYDEVKAGYEMKKIYDRKSSQLSAENASNKQGLEEQVNDLYSRILVNIKIYNSISKRIEKVRDDELQPQLIELLRGLTKTWTVMLESHKTQSRIVFEVKSNTSAAVTNNRSSHLATLQLEAEIQNWCTCFSNYITSMEAYIEALSEWAYRTIAPEQEHNTSQLVFTICHNWSNVTKNLPTKAVTYAMKRFAKDLRTLWMQQENEQQQKRKVERLVASFEKEERNIVNWKAMNEKRKKVDVLGEKMAQVEDFRKMVEIEKAKHKNCVEETSRVMLVGFQMGFSSVFDSLSEFCKVCVRKYDDVAQNSTLGLDGFRRC